MIETSSPEDFVAACIDGAVEIRRRRSKYSTSHLIENVDVRLQDGTSLSLVLKRLGDQDLLPEAAGTRPSFVDDPAREPFVYRSILGREVLGTPKLYGCRANADGDGHWLLLERVDGRELYQIGELDTWTAAACALARMHAALTPYAAGETATLLIHHDAAFYRRWAQRAIENQAWRPEHQRRALARIAAGWDDAVEFLLELPRTVVHGELYASNVLVTPRASPPRVCVVDWEMAGVGPGLIDLAALVTGWDAAGREALTGAYREELARAGVDLVDDDLARGLDHCRLYLALQWMGWAPGWVPPPDHDRDWLAEAVALSGGAA